MFYTAWQKYLNTHLTEAAKVASKFGLGLLDLFHFSCTETKPHFSF
jgi:hypothetical protein